MVFRSGKDMRYMASENPELTLEYLKLIKNLGRNYPIGKEFNPEMFKEIFGGFFSEMRHGERRSPRYSFEYLRILSRSKFENFSEKYC